MAKISERSKLASTPGHLRELELDVASSQQEAVESCVQSIQLALRIGASEPGTRERVMRMHAVLVKACASAQRSVPFSVPFS